MHFHTVDPEHQSALSLYISVEKTGITRNVE